MLPTVGDLEAYRLWGIDLTVLREMERRGSMTCPPQAAFRAALALPDQGYADIFRVMRLVQKFEPDSRTPALDHVWATKGRHSTRKDIFAFWEERRSAPDANAEVNLVALLEEVRDLLVELRTFQKCASGVGSPYASEFSTQLAGSKIDESETSTLRSIAEQILEMTKGQ